MSSTPVRHGPVKPSGAVTVNITRSLDADSGIDFGFCGRSSGSNTGFGNKKLVLPTITSATARPSIGTAPRSRRVNSKLRLSVVSVSLSAPNNTPSAARIGTNAKTPARISPLSGWVIAARPTSGIGSTTPSNGRSRAAPIHAPPNPRRPSTTTSRGLQPASNGTGGRSSRPASTASRMRPTTSPGEWLGSTEERGDNEHDRHDGELRHCRSLAAQRPRRQRRATDGGEQPDAPRRPAPEDAPDHQARGRRRQRGRDDRPHRDRRKCLLNRTFCGFRIGGRGGIRRKSEREVGFGVVVGRQERRGH